MSRLVAIGLIASVCLVACPLCARAQYDCPVSIQVDKKTVLTTTIVEVKRPPTEQLWKMLPNLLFTGTVADVDSEGRGILKGAIRVRINGAGEAHLEELHLVRHTKGGKHWLIAPDELDKILQARRSSAKARP
jgi:hypothetical protein